MKKTLCWLPLAALLMAGCSSDYTPSEQLDGPVPIHLTVSVNDLTRATTAIQSAQFGANQTFYAYFPTGVTPSTTTFETSDASGNTICTGTQPYFNQSATSASVHAYYPYVTGENGATVTNATTSFTVQTAQNVDDNYRLSDLMYGTTASAIAKDSKSVTAALTFTHRLSKIIINATAGSGISEIQEIRIIGGYRTIAITDGTTLTLNAEASGLSDANSTTSYITMYAGGSATTANCAAIIPPQTIDGNFIQVVTDKGTATYALSSKAFAGAYQYTTNLTVNLAAINATTTITPWTVEAAESGSTTDPQTLGELTEWINYYGTLETPQSEKYSGYLGWYVDNEGWIYKNSADVKSGNNIVGIVAYMSTTDVDTSIPGSRILVLSSEDVKEGSTQTFQWGTSNETSTASVSTELLDGYSNTIILTSKYGSSYAGGMCWAKGVFTGGSNWFLPSQKQLEVILQNLGDGSISTLRQKTGMQAYAYWTSTEFATNNNTANRLREDGLFYDNPKAQYWYVRACFAYPHQTTVTLSDVTIAHLGWTIADDGKVYSNGATPTYHGATPVAMVAYIGEAGSADSSPDATSYRGLAIALSDDNNTLWNSNNTTDLTLENRQNVSGAIADLSGISNTASIINSSTNSAANVARNHATQVTGCSQWFLPASGQWIKVLNLFGAGLNAVSNSGALGYLTTAAIESTVFSSLNNALNASGGTLIENDNLFYWTSTEYSNNCGIGVYFGSTQGINVNLDNKADANKVRAFFAF